MRLTTYTDYTLRVLMYLAVRHQSGERVTIDEIARSYRISRNHLMKIVHQLSVNGFIETTRGRHGGALLARDPRTISVGQIVRLCEPDFSVVECHEAGRELQCSIMPACNLKAGFRRAVDAFLLELDRISLADAITLPAMAASLLGVPVVVAGPAASPARAPAAGKPAPVRRPAPAKPRGKDVKARLSPARRRSI